MISRKAEKRDKSRLVKAEKAALIDRHIEEELLKNLQSGKYKEIWNVSQKNWENVLEKQGIQENEEEFDSEDIDNVFVSDLYTGKENEKDEEDNDKNQGDDEYPEEDLDNTQGSKKTNNTSNLSDKKFSSKKRPRSNKGKRNMEYEYETKDKEEQHNYNDW